VSVPSTPSVPPSWAETSCATPSPPRHLPVPLARRGRLRPLSPTRNRFSEPGHDARVFGEERALALRATDCRRHLRQGLSWSLRYGRAEPGAGSRCGGSAVGHQRPDARHPAGEAMRSCSSPPNWLGVPGSQPAPIGGLLLDPDAFRGLRGHIARGAANSAGRHRGRAKGDLTDTRPVEAMRFLAGLGSRTAKLRVWRAHHACRAWCRGGPRGLRGRSRTGLLLAYR